MGLDLSVNVGARMYEKEEEENVSMCSWKSKHGGQCTPGAGQGWVGGGIEDADASTLASQKRLLFL